MTIDAAALDIALEEGERWRRTLTVTVSADTVASRRLQLMKQIAGQVKLPGFRAGKVPAAVLEKRFGPAVRQEALDKLIGEAYRTALETRDLRPISEGEVQDIQYQDDQELTFQIAFDVQPQIELNTVEGFEVERPSFDVSDEEVEKVLDRLREQNGSWAPKNEGRPENGDLVSVILTRLDGPDGETEPQSYELTLGEGNAIPDVESAILTLEVGESGEFVVTFPEDFPDEEKRGEERKLRIELESRKVRELPEADDEFARTVGDFENLEELRERIREDLAQEAEDQAENAIRGQLLDRVVEANPFPVPVSMVRRYIDSMIGDSLAEMDEGRRREVLDNLSPQAEQSVKRILAIEILAEKHDLEASEDEVDARIEEIAEKNDTSPGEVYKRLQSAGRIEALQRELTEKKVFDFLKERSTIVDGA